MCVLKAMKRLPTYDSSPFNRKIILCYERNANRSIRESFLLALKKEEEKKSENIRMDV